MPTCSRMSSSPRVSPSHQSRPRMVSLRVFPFLVSGSLLSSAAHTFDLAPAHRTGLEGRDRIDRHERRLQDVYAAVLAQLADVGPSTRSKTRRVRGREFREWALGVFSVSVSVSVAGKLTPFVSSTVSRRSRTESAVREHQPIPAERGADVRSRSRRADAPRRGRSPARAREMCRGD